MAASAEWTLCLLGKPRLEGNGLALDQFGTKRAVYLLARLALSQRKAFTRAEAAELLWPDDFFDATRLRLRQELTRLRRALGPARQLLETDDEWVKLNAANLAIDVQQLEALCRQATHEADAAQKEAKLCQASALAEVPLLAGHEEPWIEAERARLTSLGYQVLVELANLQALRGDHESAVETCRKAISLDPLQEAAHLQLMNELGKLGHTSDALGQFQQLKRLLREELSATPSSDAEQLANNLLSNPPVALVAPKELLANPLFGVPASVEPIYGRETEIKRITELVGTSRIVTLTGPGGIGKTRLALEVAASSGSNFGGRVCWVGLADVSQPMDIAVAIATSLGLTLPPNADPMSRVIASLQGNPALVILDNFEQLADGGTDIVLGLAEKIPNLHLLITSRIALALKGERTVAIEPLPLPNASSGVDQPAVRVFLDPLSGEADFDELSPEDLSYVREIVTKLEGIPLALQLASGRMRLVTPKELLEQLDGRLDLRNHKVDVPERHKTLRTAIEGSFIHLPPELKEMMQNLAVFRGGWNRLAAAAVCRVEDPLPGLEKLIDSSFVLVDREDRGLRFRMLETIREYVLENAGDLTEARQRHADWIINLANPKNWRSQTSEALQELKLLDPELDNIREACRFALQHDHARALALGAALGRFWTNRSLIREALAFYETLLKDEDEPVSLDLARAVYAQSITYFISQRFGGDEPGLASSLRAARLFGELGMYSEQGTCQSISARAQQMEGKLEEALRVIDEADVLIQKFGEDTDKSRTLHMRAMIYYYQGKVEEALKTMEVATKMVEGTDSPFHEAQCAMMTAFMYVELGQVEQARARAYQGLLLAEKYEFTQFIPMIQEVCGRVEQDSSDLVKAEEWFTVSVNNWEMFGNNFQVGSLCNSLGRLKLEQGSPWEAQAWLQRGYRAWKSINLMPAMPALLTSYARYLLDNGEPEEAANCLGSIVNADNRSLDQELPAEVAYIQAINEGLQQKLGKEKLDEILASASSVSETLDQVFGK